MKAKRKTRPTRKTAATRKTAKDILRFSPGFTVYILPPESICLYSEHRKLFLHGALYCAIATAIGKNGKSRAALVRELSRNFPPDMMEEALKRLTDRRYVVEATPTTTGPAAAFWAGLGLPPETAKANLDACRVRIEALDVDGAKQLTAALKTLGVHIVDRSPDLTVTLANDYLDERLAELNRQRVKDKTPWLLVQPSGPFPLVGPVFRPCRERLLDLPVRPHDPQPGDQGLSRPRSTGRRHLATRAKPVRADRDPVRRRRDRAKRSRPAFRTDLRDHIASFDLMGATIAKHFVSHRPQCPTCGNKKLRTRGARRSRSRSAPARG